MSAVVQLVESPEDRVASWTIRERVFIREQGIDKSLERDHLDEIAWHFLARVEGVPVGTARVFGLDADHRPIPPSGAPVVKIGRMAVLPDTRRRGVGRALLDFVVSLAKRRGAVRAELSAQEYVVPFYERAGFIAEGDAYAEAGIRHRRMARGL